MNHQAIFSDAQSQSASNEPHARRRSFLQRISGLCEEWVLQLFLVIAVVGVVVNSAVSLSGPSIV